MGAAGVQSSGADAMDQKVQWVRDGAGDRFPDIELEVGGYFVAVTDDPLPAAERIGGMFGLPAERQRRSLRLLRFGLPAEDMLRHPNALIGTVDEICETLQARRERYGFSYVAIAERNAAAFAPVVARLAGT